MQKSEIISLLALYALAVPLAGYALRRALSSVRKRRDPSRGPFDLGDLRTRNSLQKLLRNHEIDGSCDIRDGLVFEFTSEPCNAVARRFRNAYSQIVQTPNAAQGDIYFAVKKPGDHPGWNYRCAGITVDNLRLVACILEDR